MNEKVGRRQRLLYKTRKENSKRVNVVDETRFRCSVKKKKRIGERNRWIGTVGRASLLFINVLKIPRQNSAPRPIKILEKIRLDYRNPSETRRLRNKYGRPEELHIHQ